MTRALLVVDVQESFRQRPNWGSMSHAQIARTVRRLAEAFRAAGDVVVWILHTEPGTGTVFDPARGFVRLLEGLGPAPGEPLLYKTSLNAFTTTNLRQLLSDKGIRELVVCGIRAEQGVEATARLAADLGYEVTFVIDATATSTVENRDSRPGHPDDEKPANPRKLSNEARRARVEYELPHRPAAIRTLDDLTD